MHSGYLDSYPESVGSRQDRARGWDRARGSRCKEERKGSWRDGPFLVLWVAVRSVTQ